MQYWSSEIEKQVGDRLQTVLNDPQLLAVYQEFGGETLRRSSVFHGLAKFLTEQQVSGHTCFEIGTWNGLTAVVLSRYFDQVVTVDIFHNPMRKRIIDFLGIKNIVCVDIVDNDQKAKVAKDLDFDFAYMDGNHADDTELDWEITKRCGRVLMHEFWPHQRPVFDLCLSLPREQVAFNGMGLALWDASK